MRCILFIIMLTLYISNVSGQPISNLTNKNYSPYKSSRTFPILLSQEVCNNNLDDDNNGLTDQGDFSCYFNSGNCNKSPVIWGCTSAGDLVWVNLETGIEHDVGKMSQFMSDLTWASNGKLYGVAGGIWEIDPNTAAIQAMPPLPDGYLGGNAMTADGPGNLYMVAVLPPFSFHIIRLSIATWQVCFIADVFAAGLSSAGDLSFFNGDLYLSSASKGNQIVKINVQTGEFDPVTVINPSTGGYYGLVNGGDGYFYASDHNKIYRIDPATMTSETLPRYTFNQPGLYLNGLANYSETCNSAKCTAKANIYSSSQPPYCKNIQLNLQADTGCNISLGIYTWATPTGSVVHTDKITVSDEGMYYLKYQISPTCSASDSFLLQYTLVPSISLGNDTSLCQREILSLNVSNPGATLVWQDGSTNNFLKVEKSGLYWAKATMNGCSYADSINVSYSPLPLVNIGADTAICLNKTLLLNAANPNIKSYLWQDGSIQSTYLVNGEGTYTVLVTDYNGCINKDTMKIDIKPLPNLDLGKDTTLCQGHTIVLSPQLSNVSYVWQDGSRSNYFIVKDTGTYVVIISNECGSTTDDIHFKTGICKLYLPNAFTSNNDGLNDIFRVKDPTFIVTFKMNIYNRWGQLVFSTNDPYKGWDGRYKNKDQPFGNYIWRIILTTRDNEHEDSAGNVILIR